MDSPLAAPIGRVARHLGLPGTLAVASILFADAVQGNEGTKTGRFMMLQ